MKSFGHYLYLRGSQFYDDHECCFRIRRRRLCASLSCVATRLDLAGRPPALKKGGSCGLAALLLQRRYRHRACSKPIQQAGAASAGWWPFAPFAVLLTTQPADPSLPIPEAGYRPTDDDKESSSRRDRLCGAGARRGPRPADRKPQSALGRGSPARGGAHLETFGSG